MDEIRIGEKTYISSKRAAEITGYAKDYVGQLCREGHVEAKMVGRSWYVLEASIREHRFGKPVNAPVATDPVVSEGSEGEDQSPEAPEMQEIDPVFANERQDQSKITEQQVATQKSWEAATYRAERDEPIPMLTDAPRRSVSVLDASSEAAGAASLTDMQLAWREWFEQRQRGQEYVQKTSPKSEVDSSTSWEEVAEEETGVQGEVETEFSSNEAIVEQNEQGLDREKYESSEEDQVQPIPIHRMSASEVAHELEESVYEPEARIIHERVVPARRTALAAHSGAGRGARLIAALLLTLTGLAALAASVLSSGVLDSHLESRGLVNPIPPFISGEMVIE